MPTILSNEDAKLVAASKKIKDSVFEILQRKQTKEENGLTCFTLFD